MFRRSMSSFGRGLLAGVQSREVTATAHDGGFAPAKPVWQDRSSNTLRYEEE